MVAPTRVNGGQLQRDRGGAGALADDDVDPEVLHRHVEHLLGGPGHPVDLVEEQHLALWREERIAARSPACWIAGPLVMRIGAPISAAMIIASVVLPRPGGPESRTWSGGRARGPGPRPAPARAARGPSPGRRTRPGPWGAAPPRPRVRSVGVGLRAGGRRAVAVADDPRVGAVFPGHDVCLEVVVAVASVRAWLSGAVGRVCRRPCSSAADVGRAGGARPRAPPRRPPRRPPVDQPRPTRAACSWSRQPEATRWRRRAGGAADRAHRAGPSARGGSAGRPSCRCRARR